MKTILALADYEVVNPVAPQVIRSGEVLSYDHDPSADAAVALGLATADATAITIRRKALGQAARTNGSLYALAGSAAIPTINNSLGGQTGTDAQETAGAASWGRHIRSLPLTRAQRGNAGAAIGDSITARGRPASAANGDYNGTINNNAYLKWAEWSGNGGWTFDVAHNFAVPGLTSRHVRDVQLPQVLALGDDIQFLHVLIGINDVILLDPANNTADAANLTNGAVVAEWRANVQHVIDSWLATGKPVLIGTIPTPNNVLTAAQGAALNEMNRIVREEFDGQNERVLLVDYDRALTSAAGTPRTGAIEASGPHPTPTGYHLMGVALRTVCDRLFAPRVREAPTALSVFSATNPLGSLLPNPVFVKTAGGTHAAPSNGGTATADAATNGGIADNWTDQCLRAGPVITSTVTAYSDGSGANWQGWNFSGVGFSADNVDFYAWCNLDLTNIAAGDVIECSFDLEFDAFKGYRELGFEIVTPTETLSKIFSVSSQGPLPDPLTWSGRVRMPRAVIPASWGAWIRLRITGNSLNTATNLGGSFRIGKLLARKVGRAEVDPRVQVPKLVV